MPMLGQFQYVILLSLPHVVQAAVGLKDVMMATTGGNSMVCCEEAGEEPGGADSTC